MNMIKLLTNVYIKTIKSISLRIWDIPTKIRLSPQRQIHAIPIQNSSLSKNPLPNSVGLRKKPYGVLPKISHFPRRSPKYYL